MFDLWLAGDKLPSPVIIISIPVAMFLALERAFLRKSTARAAQGVGDGKVGELWNTRRFPGAAVWKHVDLKFNRARVSFFIQIQ